MKLFISTLSILLFSWTANIGTPVIEVNGTFRPTITQSIADWNKDFAGLWVNEDDQTRGITKCKITHKDNSLIVQMWGSCTPQDCDWGKNETDGEEKGANRFELLWDQGFAESTVTYELVEGKLKLTNKRHFKDNSGRPDYTTTEYFVKQ